MFTGLQGYQPLRLKWTFRITIFLTFVYGTFYNIWAANNLALFVPDIGLHRYVSLNFWRLIFPFLAWISIPLTILLLFNNIRVASFYPYSLHCVWTVSAIIIELAWLVWFIIDVINCPTVVYCIGDGIPVIFAVDIAFGIAAVCQMVMLLLNFIFLFVNFYIRRKVQIRHIGDYYANPNRQPIPNAPISTLNGVNFYPTSYISSNINSDNEHEIENITTTDNRLKLVKDN
jgi:hypothetical protein